MLKFPMHVKVGDVIVEPGRPDEVVVDIQKPSSGQVWTFSVELPNGTRTHHFIGSRAAVDVRQQTAKKSSTPDK